MPEKNSETKQIFEESYDEAYDFWTAFLAEAEHDLKMFLDEQWDTNMLAYLAIRRRNALVFNRIKRVVKIVTGYERRHRLSMKIGPVGLEDDQVSSWMTGVIMHAMSSANGYNVISDTFMYGPLITGLGLIELYLDSNGDLAFRRKAYNTFLLDPSTTERDLSNCGYLTLRDMLSRDQIKALLPDRESEIDDIPDTNLDTRYSTHSFATERMGKNLLPYDQFLRKSKKRVKYLVIPERNMEKIWGDAPVSAFKELKNRLPEEMRSAKLENRWQDECTLSVLVNGEVLYDGPNTLKLDTYNYVAFFGNFCPEIDNDKLRVSGMIRVLRDPQIEFNKRLSQELDIIESQIMSGWKAEKGAVINPDSLLQAGQGATVWLHDGKIDAVEKIRPGDIPPGIAAVHQTLDKLIVELPGINEALLGTDDKDIAGVLSKLRQGAGLTGLQDWFDNLGLSKRQLGKLSAQIVQKNYSREKVERIINKQITPEFFGADLLRYDCIVQEALLTDSQRDLYYEELKALYRMAAEAGQPGAIPFGAIVKAAPIQLRDNLRQEIEQAEKQRQLASREQDEDRQLLRKLQEAEVAANLGRAVERQTESERQKAQTLTERLEAVEKIKGMGIDNVRKMVDIAKILEGDITATTTPTAPKSTTKGAA